MKNYFFLLLGLFVFSCQNEDQDYLTKNTGSDHKLTQRSSGDWKFAKTLHRDCEGIWCTLPPVNCEAFQLSSSQAISNAIASLDNASSSGYSAIQSWFTNGPVSTLFPSIDSDNLTLLQSGNYLLFKHVNPVNDPAGDGISYFVATSSPGYTNFEIVLNIAF